MPPSDQASPVSSWPIHSGPICWHWWLCSGPTVRLRGTGGHVTPPAGTHIVYAISPRMSGRFHHLASANLCVSLQLFVPDASYQSSPGIQHVLAFYPRYCSHAMRSLPHQWAAHSHVTLLALWVCPSPAMRRLCSCDSLTTRTLLALTASWIKSVLSCHRPLSLSSPRCVSCHNPTHPPNYLTFVYSVNIH